MLPPIDPAILSANPKFNVLYSELCKNKLNKDGTSQLEAKAQRDHDTLSQELHKARIEAAKRDLLKCGLQEISYTPSVLPEDLKELVVIVAAVLDGQIPEEDRYLLRDDLIKFHGNIKQIHAALLMKFKQDAAILATMLNPEEPPPTEQFAASIKQLKDAVSTSQSTLTESRISLAQEVSKLHDLYRQVLERSIRILEQVIHGSVARGAKTKADYLAVVAEGMSKKVSLQHGQLLSQLYTPAFEEALENRRSELQDENRSANRRVREAEERLDEYKKISGMGSLAQDYAAVLKEIDKVKAEIARLETTNR